MIVLEIWYGKEPELSLKYRFWSKVEYEDDPNEIAPCLACGEPKPNSQSCDCTDMWRGETEGGEDG